LLCFGFQEERASVRRIWPLDVKTEVVCSCPERWGGRSKDPAPTPTPRAGERRQVAADADAAADAADADALAFRK
jgi:hypothetical protein